MVAIKGHIGTGMYTVREAAFYARVQTALMSRWLFGANRKKAVLDPEYGGQQKLVSFLDLVQALAIREISLQHRIPLLKFRQAVEYARKKGVDYLFARKHKTFLGPNGELAVDFPGPNGGLIEATGRHKGQRLIPLTESYLQNLTFGNDGLANRYYIYQYIDPQSKGSTDIIMDPKQRFGEPLLPSGYTATAVFEAIRVEGDWESVSRVYGIPENEVEAAYRFYDHLNKPRP